MGSAAVRISERAQAILRELASQDGKTMQAVLDDAIEAYRRKRFLEEANAAYAALRADPQAWREEQEEREAWEQTLADGLEDE